MNKITVTEKEMKNPKATIYALKMSRNQLKVNNRELKRELRELKEVARHSGGKINILGEKSNTPLCESNMLLVGGKGIDYSRKPNKPTLTERLAEWLIGKNWSDK